MTSRRISGERGKFFDVPIQVFDFHLLFLASHLPPVVGQHVSGEHINPNRTSHKHAAHRLYQHHKQFYCLTRSF